MLIDQITIKHKICTECKQSKFLEEFYIDLRGIGGRKSACITCSKLRDRNGRLKNIEKYSKENNTPTTVECLNCKKILPIREFRKNPGKKFGIWRTCKPCYNSKVNKELKKIVSERHRLNKPIEVKNSKHKWAINNRPKINELTRRRAANKKKATPIWANIDAMRRIYKQAEDMTKQTGISHHVDHIVPLTSPIVQGLHCEYNLQILPARDNMSKHNRYWPDMPE